MAFLENVIGRGERIRRQARQHPAGVAKQLIIRVVQVVTLLWLRSLANLPILAELLAWPPLREIGIEQWLTPLPGYFQTLCSLLMLVVAALAVVDGLGWVGRVYALTDERLVMVHGALVKVAQEFPLEKIEELAIVQGPLGRQLGYGDIVVRTGASGEPRVLSDVHDAMAFKHALEKARRNRDPTTASAPARAVASR